MFTPTHRIRWKLDLEITVLTNWSQDTGLSNSEVELRSAGQEEEVSWDGGHWDGVAQMHLEEESVYYDQSWGRMISVAMDDFDVLQDHRR